MTAEGKFFHSRMLKLHIGLEQAIHFQSYGVGTTLAEHPDCCTRRMQQ